MFLACRVLPCYEGWSTIIDGSLTDSNTLNLILSIIIAVLINFPLFYLYKSIIYMTKRLMLQELQSYLGNVLNETLNLRNFEATLHTGIIAELERREDFEALKNERVSKGDVLLTA